MGSETPKSLKNQAEMRPQLAEDIFTSQSGSGVPESTPVSGGGTMPARSEGTDSVSEKADDIFEGSKGVNRQLTQMDRLRSKRKKLREAAVVSHAEMNEANEDYKEIQKKIIAIRKRLNEIAVKGETEEQKEEVQKLRDELAAHFVAFRKALKERPSQTNVESVPAVDTEKNADSSDVIPAEQEPHITPQYESAPIPGVWQAKAEVDYDDETRALFNVPPKEKKTEITETWNVTPDTVSYDASALELLKNGAVPPEVVEEQEQPHKFEERLTLRNEWRQKKHVFDTEYRRYIEQSATDRANRSLFERVQFWKKEKKPESLTLLEKDYRDARRAYAFSLHGAILDRIDERNPDRDTERDKRILQAALANRFIIKAANDRLHAEGEFIPHVEGKRTFQKLYNALQKNRKLVTAAGYAAVGGIALASGGVAVAVGALAGRAVQTKITTAAIAGGLTVGSLAGNLISDAYIKHKDNVRTDALRNAAQSFSGRNLDRLEIEYLNSYRSYTKAVENKKVIVGTGAALGALSGALIAGNFEVPEELPPIADGPVAPEPPIDEIPETPEVPVPPLDIPAEPEPIIVPEMPSILFTFEGGEIDTVSEALFETWKDNPTLFGTECTQSEFLAQMYGAIAEIEKSPELNTELMESMHITSNNIHEVALGQSIDLQPFFEYLNNRH